jgi:hypothetical protein
MGVIERTVEATAAQAPTLVTGRGLPEPCTRDDGLDGESGGRSVVHLSSSAYVDLGWLGPTEVVPGSYDRGHRQDQETVPVPSTVKLSTTKTTVNRARMPAKVRLFTTGDYATAGAPGAPDARYALDHGWGADHRDT